MSLTSYQAAPPCNKWEADRAGRHCVCQRVFLQNLGFAVPIPLFLGDVSRPLRGRVLANTRLETQAIDAETKAVWRRDGGPE